ncbi:hypothetical protein BH23PSE1_BH23PSE1_06480 [soil metagenome]
MKSLFAAAGAAITLAAMPVLAQDQTGTAGMADSLAVVESSVSSELARLGVQQETRMLTLDQLLQMQLIFDDESLSDQEKSQQIQNVIDGA